MDMPQELSEINGGSRQYTPPILIQLPSQTTTSILGKGVADTESDCLMIGPS